MTRFHRLPALLAVTAIAVAACSSPASPAPPSATAAPTAAPATQAPESAAPATPAPTEAPAWANPAPDSLLGKILASNKIRISTDPNYAPFSFLDTATGKYIGFDTSTAEETVKRMNEILGKSIELQWETPNWDLITAGSWGGRWDMSVGSMSVTVARAKVVDFTDPYYYDFGFIAIPKDSTVTKISDLDGKRICVGAATTYESWLKGTLEVPGTIAPPPVNADITSLPTDNECVQAYGAGRTFDALVANENSLDNAIKQGAALKILQIPPPFVVQVSFALDKSGPDTTAMLALCNKIIADMHADGTLTKFSMQFLDKDVTKAPAP